MSTPDWADPTVTSTLSDVVDDLGRRVALDPSRLRAALNDSLGSRAHEFRTEIDTLVISAEAGAPQGLLRAEDPEVLRAQLQGWDVRPEVADWALSAWRSALRITSVGTPPPTALPDAWTAPLLPPTALPPADLTQLPDPARLPDLTQLPDLTRLPDGPGGPDDRTRLPPETAPAGPVSGVTQTAGSSPYAWSPTAPHQDVARPGARRRLVGLLVAAGAVVLVGGGAGAIALTRDNTSAGTTPVVPPAIQTLPGSTAPVPTGETSPAPPTVAPLRVLAHRGGEERHGPESAPALVDAAKRGQAAEADIRWTSDGVAVVVHDTRTAKALDCGKNYVVAETRWSTLRTKCRIKPASAPDRRKYPVSTFAEVTSQVSAVEGAQLFAEIKAEQSPAQVKAFYNTLAQRGMVERTVVESRMLGELSELGATARKAGKPVRLMLYVRDRRLTPAQAKKAGLWGVSIRHNAVTPAYVRSLKAAGLTVVAWTPNTEKDWARMRAAGVDSVVTDRPAAYVRWRAGR